MTLLQILLALALCLISLVGVGYLLLLLGMRKDLRRALEFANRLNEARSGEPPQSLTLVSSPMADWSRPAVDRFAAPLRRLGFSPIGVFRLAEVPGIDVYPLLHHEGWCYAAVNHLVAADQAWFEFNAVQEDGTVIELMSSPLLSFQKTRADKVQASVTNWTPPAALMKFASMCRGRNLKRLTPEEYEEHFVEDARRALKLYEERFSDEPEGGSDQ